MTNAFTNLLATTEPLTEDVIFERPPVAQILVHAHESDGLDIDSSWSLHPREAQRIETRVNTRPVAGFERLVPLMAGAHAFEATNDGFFAQEEANLWEAKSNDQVRIELCEAFTRRLVPPTLAAAFGIALGMHPLFVLSVAGRVGSTKTPSIFNDTITEEVTEQSACALFTAIGTIQGALSRLPEGVTIPFSALTELVSVCIEEGHRIGRQIQLDAIEPFKTEPPSPVGVQMATNDLISQLLIPAGAAVRTRGNRLAVDSKLLAKVGIASVPQGELDRTLSQLFDMSPVGHRLH